MEVDGLEAEVDVEGPDKEEDGLVGEASRGLLRGADGPGGDMNDDEEEEEDNMEVSAVGFNSLVEANTSKAMFSIGRFRPSRGREHSEQTWISRCESMKFFSHTFTSGFFLQC